MNEWNGSIYELCHGVWMTIEFYMVGLSSYFISFYLTILVIIAKPTVKRNGLLNRLLKVNDQMPRIFIIHGHDMISLSKLKLVIYTIGGLPITFADLPKEGSQTVIEILEKHVPNFSAIIVLLTPDDEGKEVGGDTLELRARQNVLIEAGHGIISRRDKSLLIALGGVSIPSDFEGILRVTDTNWSPEVGLNVAKRLVEIGLKVDPSKGYLDHT